MSQRTVEVPAQQQQWPGSDAELTPPADHGAESWTGRDRLRGKRAVVTGGDSGIGWNTARILLAEGATVVVTDIDQSRLDTSADQLEAPLGKLHAFAADVRSAESLAALHDKVREAVGEIDILVQSSGVTGAQGMFHEIDEAGWAETISRCRSLPWRFRRRVTS